MSDDAWGFADIYSLDAKQKDTGGALEDVQGDDWRNILVLGRATADGVYPETLALVGRARHLADELGCRVEVLLIGNDLGPATEVLKKYPINNVYRVKADGYAPIDATARILEAVVKKRRPELVMAFQSRTGDAVIAYTASRLGVGFAHGATSVEIDTYERRARAVHVATNTQFQITTEFQHYPQFVSVQRGLFRAPMEDPYADVKLHDLEVDVRGSAAIDVVSRQDVHPPTLENAERVVVAGARVRSVEEVDAARDLATRVGAVFAVTRSVRDRGLAGDAPLVGHNDQHIAPRLLICVGVRGSLDFTEAITGDPVICAIGSMANDPIAKKAAYLVTGAVDEAVKAVLDSF